MTHAALERLLAEQRALLSLLDGPAPVEPAALAAAWARCAEAGEDVDVAALGDTDRRALDQAVALNRLLAARVAERARAAQDELALARLARRRLDGAARESRAGAPTGDRLDVRG